MHTSLRQESFYDIHYQKQWTFAWFTDTTIRARGLQPPLPPHFLKIIKSYWEKVLSAPPPSPTLSHLSTPTFKVAQRSLAMTGPINWQDDRWILLSVLTEFNELIIPLQANLIKLVLLSQEQRSNSTVQHRESHSRCTNSHWTFSQHWPRIQF